jgi:hypothetical protein
MKTAEPLYKQLSAVRHFFCLAINFFQKSRCIGTQIGKAMIQASCKQNKNCTYAPTWLRLAKPRYKLLLKNLFRLSSDWQSLACYNFFLQKNRCICFDQQSLATNFF